MTESNPTGLFDEELQRSGMPVSASDRERLYPLWEENLERRTRLRSEVFTFEDAPITTLHSGEPLLRPAVPVHHAPSQPLGDPCDMSVAEQARLLSVRSLSSLELTDAYLARIERGNATLRSFITVDVHGARKAATRADHERSNGNVSSPLHGIPIAVKDMIAVGGLRMTAGSQLLVDNVAERDATVVAQLRAAGAIILGTNTLLEFGSGPYLKEGPFATGVNPWDAARIPGGSSSGSAIAVAVGFCSAALGTDTAGSVRMPASYNGVVGLKPTRGHINLSGVVPFCWSLDTVGTLTRSVEDAALVMNAVADPVVTRERPGATGTKSFEKHLGASLRGLRIGVLRRECVDAPDIRDDVRQAFENALEVFRAHGVKTFDVEIPELSWNDVVYTTMLAEAHSLHAPSLRSDPDKYTESLRLQLYAGGFVTADELERARRLQGRMTRAALGALVKCDALAFPGQAAPPPLLGASSRPALTQPRSRFTRPWNVTGLPVLATPCGFSTEGLPLSIHLAGRPFDEATLFRLGYGYQRETDWHRRRPTWNA
jgi:aspartyl-tRNA(Asn)/glutamyl-tRNA(Gln) amidotransferase subunit A